MLLTHTQHLANIRTTRWTSWGALARNPNKWYGKKFPVFFESSGDTSVRAFVSADNVLCSACS